MTKLIKTASKVIGVQQTFLKNVLLKKAYSIINCPSAPLYKEFVVLPSGHIAIGNLFFFIHVLIMYLFSMFICVLMCCVAPGQTKFPNKLTGRQTGRLGLVEGIIH